MIKDFFEVPDYYPAFHCKGKDCRNCCCQGWKITLTQDEYFRLQSIDCSKEMKDKIEAYVSVLPHPNMDEYARINFNYLGACPLRLENGYCGLQVECGEENIPSVCRYYPRSPRLYPKKECCISSSCEWVVERMIGQKGPFHTISKELSFLFEDDEKKEEIPENYTSIRKHCIEILEEGKGLKEKLIEIISYMKDDVSVLTIENISSILMEIRKDYARSVSIASYLEDIKQDKSMDKILSLLHQQNQETETWISKVLVNHLFYMKFPFLPLKDRKDVSLALYLMVYLYLEILFYSWKGDKNGFVDITSAFFRVGEHSNIYEVILFHLHRLQQLKQA